MQGFTISKLQQYTGQAAYNAMKDRRREDEEIRLQMADSLQPAGRDNVAVREIETDCESVDTAALEQGNSYSGRTHLPCGENEMEVDSCSKAKEPFHLRTVISDRDMDGAGGKDAGSIASSAPLSDPGSMGGFGSASGSESRPGIRPDYRSSAAAGRSCSSAADAEGDEGAPGVEVLPPADLVALVAASHKDVLSSCVSGLNGEVEFFAMAQVWVRVCVRICVRVCVRVYVWRGEGGGWDECTFFILGSCNYDFQKIKGT